MLNSFKIKMPAFFIYCLFLINKKWKIKVIKIKANSDIIDINIKVFLAYPIGLLKSIQINKKKVGKNEIYDKTNANLKKIVL